MAALDAALAVEPQPDQNVAAEGFDQAKAFANLAVRFDRGLNFAVRQAAENLVE